MDFIISIDSKPSVTLVFMSIETDGIYINFVGTVRPYLRGKWTVREKTTNDRGQTIHFLPVGAIHESPLQNTNILMRMSLSCRFFFLRDRYEMGDGSLRPPLCFCHLKTLP